MTNPYTSYSYKGAPLPLAAIIFMTGGIFMVFISIRTATSGITDFDNSGYIKVVFAATALYVFHAAVLIIASIAAFRGGKRARSYAQLACWISIAGVFARLVFIGIYQELIIHLVIIACAVIVMAYLNRQDIVLRSKKNRLPAPITFLIIWIILIMVSVYAVMFINYGLSTPYVKNPAYNINNTDSGDFFQLPYKFNVKIPDTYKLIKIYHEKDDSVSLIFRGTYNSLIRLSSFSPVSEAEKIFAPLAGGKDNFYKKYFHERYGLLFILMKRITEHSANGEFKHIYLRDGVEAYITVRSGDKTGEIVYFYKNNELLGEVFYISGEQQDTGFITELLKYSSYNTNQFTSEQYYEEANKKLELKKYEEAKELYAFALSKNWKSPEAHYGFAVTLLETGFEADAKSHAEIVLRFNKHHKGANAILQTLNSQ